MNGPRPDTRRDARPEDRSRHAELIIAEVAHELALARGALRRTPHPSVVDRPEPPR